MQYLFMECLENISPLCSAVRTVGRRYLSLSRITNYIFQTLLILWVQITGEVVFLLDEMPYHGLYELLQSVLGQLPLPTRQIQLVVFIALLPFKNILSDFIQNVFFALLGF